MKDKIYNKSLELLREFEENATDEEIDDIIREIDSMNIGGPTIDEYYNTTKMKTEYRKFNKMIFHGNGKHSYKKVSELMDRVDYGHMILSGLQQGIPKDTTEYDEGMIEIQNVCRDVLASFGFSDDGLKWNDLPY